MLPDKLPDGRLELFEASPLPAQGEHLHPERAVYTLRLHRWPMAKACWASRSASAKRPSRKACMVRYDTA